MNIVIIGLIVAGALAFWYLTKKVVAAPPEDVIEPPEPPLPTEPPWEPSTPLVVTERRFFDSYEISPQQPQAIWVFVIAPYTVESTSRNPTTQAVSSNIGSGGSVYSSDLALQRYSFDHLMAKSWLNDQNARSLAELVTLFNFD